MSVKASVLKELETAAAKAAARAAAAKAEVRLAKAELKQARKVFKAAKKAAKQARRQADAAGNSRPPRPAATRKVKPAIRKAAVPGIGARRTPKKTLPRRVSRARVPRAPQMRSAAEIAKTVIERLHAPPPILPPAPVIPPQTNADSGGSTPATPANS